MITAARIATSAMNIVAFLLFAMEAAAYRAKNKEFDELINQTKTLQEKTRSSLKRAKQLEEEVWRGKGEEKRCRLPEMHTARKYGAEYIRTPMRAARIIPGTRNEERTIFYANDLEIEYESVISYEAELDGELIKVVERMREGMTDE